MTKLLGTHAEFDALADRLTGRGMSALKNDDWGFLVIALEEAVELRAEAAAPEPPVVIDGTPSSGGAEPVAWQWKPTERTWVMSGSAGLGSAHWRTVDDERIARRMASDWAGEVRPLYAAPSALVPAGEVAEAARVLVGRLDEIHEDEGYKSVWILTANRGMPYTGPTYVRELEVLRAALTAFQPRADAGVTEAEREAVARHLAADHARKNDADDYDWDKTDHVWKSSFRRQADDIFRAALAAREVR